MEFQIKHRFNDSILFTAEIEATEETPFRLQLGLAIRKAVKAGANLADANLADAYLAGANLAGAYLADANLADANLADANLVSAYLAGANLTGAYLVSANLAGANLAGAKYNGVPLTKTPITVSGFPYRVTILDNHAQIGCQLKTIAEWLACDLSGFAPYKGAFRAICAASGRLPAEVKEEMAV
jgi:uncharacterized protein YjbI with pentapeptide repeats